MYRDFLKESYELLKLETLQKGYEEFSEVAIMWNKVAEIFDSIKGKEDVKKIEEASMMLKEIASKEKDVFELLSTI